MSTSTRASSETWKLAPADAQPAAAAVHRAPRPGTSTSSSSTKAMRAAAPRPFCQHLGRHPENTSAAQAAPIASGTAGARGSRTACRVSWLAIEIEAEVTITSPSSMSREHQRDASPCPGAPRRSWRSSARSPWAMAVRAHAASPAHGRGGNTVAALRVVAEHVEARAGRRQQHRVAGLRGGRRRGRPPPAASRCATGAHTPRKAALEARRIARRSAPRGAPCRGTRRRAALKSWPLPSPPAIMTSGPAMPATAASVAPTLVPLESST